MKTLGTSMMSMAAMAVMTGGMIAAEPPATPPDLTRSTTVDRSRTYNLGATGMRGWIYTLISRPAGRCGFMTGKATVFPSS